MAFEDGSKKELQKVSLKLSKDFPLTRTTLASMESLSLPVVQQVVLSADMQCEKCQKRVADILTKMNALVPHVTDFFSRDRVSGGECVGKEGGTYF
uniref:HMA domain-containing protein n=1 Tax=Glycine max TaxID=3847 RepID=A0A0R0EA08_SOYBN